MNNQSTGRKRRDVGDFSIVVDASGPTVEADLTDAVEENGGAIVTVEYSSTDNGGSGGNNGGSGTDNGGSGTDNGETITTTPAVTTKSQPVTDPDTGVEIIDPPTVQKTAQIQISDVTIDASDISDEVKTLIG